MNNKNPEGRILFKVFTEVGIIYQLSAAALEKTLPEDLKISQFGVLNHFVRLGDGSTPLQLATAFQVTKGAMTNTLKRLLDRELIVINPDPIDGRKKNVYITKKGRDIQEQCIQGVEPMISYLQKMISESEFRSALPFLQKLRIILDEERNP